MRLPNAEHAIIPIAKLRDYSLNAMHPEGKHKARVFRSALGLTTSDAGLLRQMILDAIRSDEAVEQPPMLTAAGLSLTSRFRV